MRKCIVTALWLMLLAAAASAQPLTLDGPTAVQSFDGHRALVVVDSDGDGRADHLFRLWSERPLPCIDEAFVRAHVEFEPHRLRILTARAAPDRDRGRHGALRARAGRGGLAGLSRIDFQLFSFLKFSPSGFQSF